MSFEMNVDSRMTLEESEDCLLRCEALGYSALCFQFTVYGKGALHDFDKEKDGYEKRLTTLKQRQEQRHRQEQGKEETENDDDDDDTCNEGEDDEVDDDDTCKLEEEERERGREKKSCQDQSQKQRQRQRQRQRQKQMQKQRQKRKQKQEGKKSNTINKCKCQILRKLRYVVQSLGDINAFRMRSDISDYFDLIAVSPENQECLNYICNISSSGNSSISGGGINSSSSSGNGSINIDDGMMFDILSLDFSRRLPVTLNNRLVSKCEKNHLFFEINYEGLIPSRQLMSHIYQWSGGGSGSGSDGKLNINLHHEKQMKDYCKYNMKLNSFQAQRQQFLTNVMTLVNLSRHGRNIVCSSGASSFHTLRSVYDVTNLLVSLVGFSQENAINTMTVNCQQCLSHAQARRYRNLGITNLDLDSIVMKTQNQMLASQLKQNNKSVQNSSLGIPNLKNNNNDMMVEVKDNDKNNMMVDTDGSPIISNRNANTNKNANENFNVNINDDDKKNLTSKTNLSNLLFGVTRASPTPKLTPTFNFDSGSFTSSSFYDREQTVSYLTRYKRKKDMDSIITKINNVLKPNTTDAPTSSPSSSSSRCFSPSYSSPPPPPSSSSSFVSFGGTNINSTNINNNNNKDTSNNNNYDNDNNNDNDSWNGGGFLSFNNSPSRLDITNNDDDDDDDDDDDEREEGNLATSSYFARNLNLKLKTKSKTSNRTKEKTTTKTTPTKTAAKTTATKPKEKKKELNLNQN